MCLLKLDFSNVFNECSRHSVLEEPHVQVDNVMTPSSRKEAEVEGDKTLIQRSLTQNKLLPGPLMTL